MRGSHGVDFDETRFELQIGKAKRKNKKMMTTLLRKRNSKFEKGAFGVRVFKSQRKGTRVGWGHLIEYWPKQPLGLTPCLKISIIHFTFTYSVNSFTLWVNVHLVYNLILRIKLHFIIFVNVEV